MKKVSREDAMNILKDLKTNHPDEYNLFNQLVKSSENVNEGTSKELLDKVVKGWRNYSLAFLTAMTMTPALASDLKDYSLSTFNAIEKEIAIEKSKETPTAIGTVTPARTPITGEVASFDFGENFNSGERTLTGKEGLVKNIKDIKQWCEGKNLKNFKIVITASESQVTNPKGFEKPKSLAQARAKVIEDLVSNLGFGKIEIDTQVGKTAYKAGVDNPDDLKYKREQFVTVSVVVENSVCSMAPFTESGTQGTYEEYVSGKGELVVYTGTIPDRLVVLDAKGNVKSDTGYVATEETNSKSGYQEWKYVPIYVLKLTELKGDAAIMGSKVITKQFDNYQDLVNYMLKPGAKQSKSDSMADALSKLEAMFTGGGPVEFVFYEVGKGDKKVPFDDSRGDVKAKVYSPVGKTGFKITGLCVKP
jgi:hypothetical protein